MIAPQLENNYSKEEIENILSSLASIGIVNMENSTLHRDFLENYSITFFSINEVLLPHLDRFICIKKSEVDSMRYNGEIKNIYITITRILFASKQLSVLNIEFTIKDYDEDRFVIQIEHNNGYTNFIFRNKSEFIVFISDAINTIFNINNIDQLCFSLTVVEDICFLFADKISYCRIINERLLLVDNVRYPEIENWKESEKDEPLLF